MNWNYRNNLLNHKIFFTKFQIYKCTLKNITTHVLSTKKIKINIFLYIDFLLYYFVL